MMHEGLRIKHSVSKHIEKDSVLVMMDKLPNEVTVVSYNDLTNDELIVAVSRAFQVREKAIREREWKPRERAPFGEQLSDLIKIIDNAKRS